jgi:hypothetical protein
LKTKGWITGLLLAVGVLLGTFLGVTPAHAAEVPATWHTVSKRWVEVNWRCGQTHDIPDEVRPLSYQACIQFHFIDGFRYRAGVVVHNRSKDDVEIVGTTLQLRINPVDGDIIKVFYDCQDSILAGGGLVICYADMGYPDLVAVTEARAFAQLKGGKTVGSPNIVG